MYIFHMYMSKEPLTMNKTYWQKSFKVLLITK